MIAVLFDVELAKDRRETYIEMATLLRPLLDQIDGFISIERFQSLADSNRILSVSFWRDEEAVQQWRNMEAHRQAQYAGRNGVFANYRLRVAEILRDYEMNMRDQAPRDSQREHG